VLEHGQEQRVLVLVVVDQALVEARPFGDALDPGAAQAVGGELVPRDAQDGLARAVHIPLFGRGQGVVGVGHGHES
jgi:hypothetical protein